jgi:hypothetical protein
MKNFNGKVHSLNTTAILWLVFVGIILIPGRAVAQSDDKATSATTQVQQAAKQGFPLSTTSNVIDNVSVEAVLIPPKVARNVFGKTVADNYAVIALTISNRSSEASLIVHSIFIDYSRWILSGYSDQDDACNDYAIQRNQSGGNSESRSSDSAIGGSTHSRAKSGPELHQKCNPPQAWQTQTTPNQIASVESRIVRGQLLDRQPWTTRNWVIRVLQAAGSIASAYTFTLSGQHVIQSIGAFNGQVVPAAETFWPDSTIGQMNRISDMGFQVNKVISKESSDIVVSFFPIDRFLTPGLKKLFISSPAVFFAPNSLVLDKTARDQLAPLITPLFDTTDAAKAFMSNLPKNFMDSTADHTVLDFLNRASLNTVHIIVGGSMNIEIDAVPAKIDSIEIDTPANTSVGSLLTKAGDIQGSIHGSFLSGGQPSIAEADQLGINNVVALPDASTDKQLNFKMSLTKPIPESQKKLTFKVIKKNSKGVTVESVTFDYQLPPLPAVSSPKTNGIPATSSNDASSSRPKGASAPSSNSEMPSKE